jgi:ankyrin repeat protein
MTDLLEALYRGDDEKVAELLAADPELSVFEAAAFGRTARLGESLDEDPTLANAFGDDGFQPLGLACFFGHVDAARLLLDRGADPNRPGEGGFTALHAAAQNGDEGLARLLLERGADASVAADDGRRPADLGLAELLA